MKEQLIKILKEELVPAIGCTEPLAISLASAKAREVLGDMPERLEVYACNNIVKNVKSVVVPHTGNLKGIEISAALGMVAGKAENFLEVLKDVTQEDVAVANEFVMKGKCKVFRLESDSTLHLIVKAFSNDNVAEVEILNSHTNISRIVKNGEILLDKSVKEKKSDKLNFKLSDIYDFAKNIELEEIQEVIESQIETNKLICEEGLKNDYGKRIGKTLLSAYSNDLYVRARAFASAGSEARMNGCPMAVVINSGSGNQGITVSMPIYVFAKEKGKTREELIRAVALSNLIAIHMKKGIGKLSAYCGVVSASSGVAAGLVFLMGGDFEKISKAVSNTVANVAGIICDGAKSSCAAKICSSVDAAILAYNLAMKDTAFDGGDGIISSCIEDTIDNVMKLGKDGMKQTDDEIINIMIHNK